MKYRIVFRDPASEKEQWEKGSVKPVQMFAPSLAAAKATAEKNMHGKGCFAEIYESKESLVLTLNEVA